MTRRESGRESEAIGTEQQLGADFEQERSAARCERTISGVVPLLSMSVLV
jgi:hypothetical protein